MEKRSSNQYVAQITSSRYLTHLECPGRGVPPLLLAELPLLPLQPTPRLEPPDALDDCHVGVAVPFIEDALEVPLRPAQAHPQQALDLRADRQLAPRRPAVVHRLDAEAVAHDVHRGEQLVVEDEGELAAEVRQDARDVSRVGEVQRQKVLRVGRGLEGVAGAVGALAGRCGRRCVGGKVELAIDNDPDLRARRRGDRGRGWL